MCSRAPQLQEDEALDVLRIISKGLAKAKLRGLNLSDNALGEKGVRACAEVLTAQVGRQLLGLAGWRAGAPGEAKEMRWKWS